MYMRTPWRIPLIGIMVVGFLLGLVFGVPPARAASAAATLEPSVTLPNNDVTLSGSGFPGNSFLTVSTTVSLRGGGNHTVTTTGFTDSFGDFAVAFFIPYLAAPGTYPVTARAGGVQTTNQLRILPLSAHPSNLTFRWISLWYHTVRHGTWDYVSLQASLQTTLGIWVHVIFPSGQHYDYYTGTDGGGHWSKRFTIPRNSISRHSNQAYITFQLWHGHQTTQSFMSFTLV